MSTKNHSMRTAPALLDTDDQHSPSTTEDRPEPHPDARRDSIANQISQAECFRIEILTTQPDDVYYDTLLLGDTIDEVAPVGVTEGRYVRQELSFFFVPDSP